MLMHVFMQLKELPVLLVVLETIKKNLIGSDKVATCFFIDY
jgi:hypothetical protein